MDIQNEKSRLDYLVERSGKIALAILAVATLTVIMFLIGRDTLGEGVIALLYLLPIGWATARWGQGPGIAAAISAALAFNFFFIPPYYTLYIGSLEGWLLLGIFLVVAIVIVGRIQSGFAQAKRREGEAVFMYELSAALSGGQTAESIAHILAGNIQQLYQAARVQVFVNENGHHENGHSITASVPEERTVEGKPDLILPILTTDGLAGEIQVWQGTIRLPTTEDRLVKNLTNQGALALERARLARRGEAADEPAKGKPYGVLRPY